MPGDNFPNNTYRPDAIPGLPSGDSQTGQSSGSSEGGQGGLFTGQASGRPVEQRGEIGPQGPAGPQGNPGPMGDPGNPGVGVQSATVDANGMLTITLTDGTTQGPFDVGGDDGRGVASVRINGDNLEIAYTDAPNTFTSLGRVVGQDGRSIGSVTGADSKSGRTTTVTLTFVDTANNPLGTTTFDVLDGTDGSNGSSVTASGTDGNVTITDSASGNTFLITDGRDGSSVDSVRVALDSAASSAAGNVYDLFVTVGGVETDVGAFTAPTGPAGSGVASDITDGTTTVANPTDITFVGATVTDNGGGAATVTIVIDSLGELNDVEINNPRTANYLRYNETTARWENQMINLEDVAEFQNADTHGDGDGFFYDLSTNTFHSRRAAFGDIDGFNGLTIPTNLQNPLLDSDFASKGYSDAEAGRQAATARTDAVNTARTYTDEQIANLPVAAIQLQNGVIVLDSGVTEAQLRTRLGLDELFTGKLDTNLGNASVTDAQASTFRTTIGVDTELAGKADTNLGNISLTDAQAASARNALRIVQSSGGDGHLGQGFSFPETPSIGEVFNLLQEDNGFNPGLWRWDGAHWRARIQGVKVEGSNEILYGDTDQTIIFNSSNDANANTRIDGSQLHVEFELTLSTTNTVTGSFNIGNVVYQSTTDTIYRSNSRFNGTADLTDLNRFNPVSRPLQVNNDPTSNVRLSITDNQISGSLVGDVGGTLEVREGTGNQIATALLTLDPSVFEVTDRGTDTFITLDNRPTAQFTPRASSAWTTTNTSSKSRLTPVDSITTTVDTNIPGTFNLDSITVTAVVADGVTLNTADYTIDPPTGNTSERSVVVSSTVTQFTTATTITIEIDAESGGTVRQVQGQVTQYLPVFFGVTASDADSITAASDADLVALGLTESTEGFTLTRQYSMPAGTNHWVIIATSEFTGTPAWHLIYNDLPLVVDTDPADGEYAVQSPDLTIDGETYRAFNFISNIGASIIIRGS